MDTQDRTETAESFSSISTQNPPQRAHLTIGANKLSVLAFDEPGEGLSALIENPPPLWVDDTGLLESSEGTMKVRVTYVIRIELDDDPETEGTPPVFRIGLTQDAAEHSILMDHDEESPSSCTRPGQPHRRLRGLVLSVLAFGLLAALGYVAWRHSKPAAPSVPGISTVPSVPSEAKPQAEDLAARVRGLGGVEPFLLPEVIARLKFSDAQVAQFRRLHETSQEARRQADNYWQADSLAEHTRKQQLILDAARQRAVKELTKEQAAAWREIAN